MRRALLLTALLATLVAALLVLAGCVDDEYPGPPVGNSVRAN